jgi:hypothetical protein
MPTVEERLHKLEQRAEMDNERWELLILLSQKVAADPN